MNYVATGSPAQTAVNEQPQPVLSIEIQNNDLSTTLLMIAYDHGF